MQNPQAFGLKVIRHQYEPGIGGKPGEILIGRLGGHAFDDLPRKLVKIKGRPRGGVRGVTRDQIPRNRVGQRPAQTGRPFHCVVTPKRSFTMALMAMSWKRQIASGARRDERIEPYHGRQAIAGTRRRIADATASPR